MAQDGQMPLNRLHTMTTKRSFFVYIACMAVLALTLLACSGNEHRRVRRAAERCYEYLLDGRYDRFVDEIAYADSMSDDYRAQMVDLVEEFASSQRVLHGEMVGVEAVGDTIIDDAAHVYLQLSFADSTSEEVGLPMVKVGKRWKMQ